MSFIYKIINDINDKVYIGKTAFSIEKRFKEHCADAFKEHCENRPLYSAMRKYGINHFQILEIEQCEDSAASDREAYWISKYRAYELGYNATLGGDGKFLFNHQDILESLVKNPYPKEIAEQFGCSQDLVYDIAKANSISCKNRGNDLLKATSKNIQQFSKRGEFIQEFESTVEASKWCFDNKCCLTLNSGVRSHIAECANGKRKSAYGYIWRYSANS